MCVCSACTYFDLFCFDFVFLDFRHGESLPACLLFVVLTHYYALHSYCLVKPVGISFNDEMIITLLLLFFLLLLMLLFCFVHDDDFINTRVVSLCMCSIRTHILTGGLSILLSLLYNFSMA